MIDGKLKDCVVTEKDQQRRYGLSGYWQSTGEVYAGMTGSICVPIPNNWMRR